MGFLLKALSVITGSNEETLLNARAELSNNFGSGHLSNETERDYVFNELFKFFQKNGIPNELKNEPTGAIIGFVLDYLSQDKKNTKFLQVTNRVMVDFYNFELGNSETLIRALMKMGHDFEYYIEKKMR
ncbi:hypothetical protein UACE39S_05812 [Ureibacillus acetophenoni]